MVSYLENKNIDETNKLILNNSQNIMNNHINNINNIIRNLISNKNNTFKCLYYSLDSNPYDNSGYNAIICLMLNNINFNIIIDHSVSNSYAHQGLDYCKIKTHIYLEYEQYGISLYKDIIEDLFNLMNSEYLLEDLEDVLNDLFPYKELEEFLDICQISQESCCKIFSQIIYYVHKNI